MASDSEDEWPERRPPQQCRLLRKAREWRDGVYDSSDDSSDDESKKPPQKKKPAPRKKPPPKKKPAPRKKSSSAPQQQEKSTAAVVKSLIGVDSSDDESSKKLPPKKKKKRLPPPRRVLSNLTTKVTNAFRSDGGTVEQSVSKTSAPKRSAPVKSTAAPPVKKPAGPRDHATQVSGHATQVSGATTARDTKPLLLQDTSCVGGSQQDAIRGPFLATQIEDGTKSKKSDKSKKIPLPIDLHPEEKQPIRQEFLHDSPEVMFIDQFFNKEMAYSNQKNTVAILCAIMMGNFESDHNAFCDIQATLVVMYECSVKDTDFQDDEGQAFLDRINTLKEMFAYDMSQGGKYHFNTGDDIRHGVYLLIYKHWAPLSELIAKFLKKSRYRDPFNSASGVMNRKNPCLRSIDILARCMMTRDMNKPWTDAIQSELDSLVNFTDSIGVIPQEKKTIVAESRTYARAAGLGSLKTGNGGYFDPVDVLYSILVPFVGAQAMYNKYTIGMPRLNVMVMSHETRDLFRANIFQQQLEGKGHFSSETAVILFLSHGQTWVMRVALMNTLTHTDNHLRMYENSLSLGFTACFAKVLGMKEDDVLDILKKTTIARGFAKRGECDIDDETRNHRLESIIANLRENARKGGLIGGRKAGLIGGKVFSDRFKCVQTAFSKYEEHMMDVCGHVPSFEEFIESIPELFDGDESINIQDAIKGIENSRTFKIMVAANADKLDIATTEQLELLRETREAPEKARNEEAKLEREKTGGDTQQRKHRCKKCGNEQSFMFGQRSTCKNKVCTNRTQWDCLEKENIVNFTIDRKAVAAVTLPAHLIPKSNQENYPGVTKSKTGKNKYKYMAKAGIQSKDCYLGLYDTTYEAATMVAKAKFLYKSK